MRTALNKPCQNGSMPGLVRLFIFSEVDSLKPSLQSLFSASFANWRRPLALFRLLFAGGLIKQKGDETAPRSSFF